MKTWTRCVPWTVIALVAFLGSDAGAAAVPSPGADESGAAKSEPGKTPPPPIHVKCVFVRDHELGEGFDLDTHGVDKSRGMTSKQLDANPAPKIASARIDDEVCPKETSTVKTVGKLIGAGDLVVVVPPSDYEAATGYQQKNDGAAMLLYVNGVPLGHDADLQSVEFRDGSVHLRYRIVPGKDAQALWANLFQDGGLTAYDGLRVALGWTKWGPISTPQAWDGRATVAITSTLKTYVASAFLIILVGITYLIGRATDVLRDAPLPAWWNDARDLRASKPKEKADEWLKTKYPAYDPISNAYGAAAESALARIPVPAEREQDAIIGLIMRSKNWSPVRASFSLARVQLAIWFTFAVATGVFLWIVYGRLPAIDGSLLGLLGLSVATTGVSLATDRNAGGREYTPSQGFFTDLVTGFDEKQQVHRYQAVVVNLLLLLVGTSHVLQQLTYPIFEPSWLALLGLSGAALALGKQMLEQPAVSPPPQGSATASHSAVGAPAEDGAVG